jgi:hypothetical protein
MEGSFNCSLGATVGLGKYQGVFLVADTVGISVEEFKHISTAMDEVMAALKRLQRVLPALDVFRTRVFFRLWISTHPRECQSFSIRRAFQDFSKGCLNIRNTENLDFE